MRRPLLLACAALSLGSLIGSLGATPVGASTRTDIRAKPFALKAIDVPNTDFGEPSIAISPKDHVFICGPLGFPSGIDHFVRTADWKSFQYQDIFDPGGGGDCDVKVGVDGAVYTASLQVFGSRIRKSVDDGVTFPQTMSWEEPVEEDRQWLATDPTDPNIVYFAYHDFVLEAEIAAKSTDGGQTFLQHALVSNDPAMAADTFPNTFSGPVRVDPSDPNRVYLVWGISTLERNAQQCVDSPPDCPFGDRVMVVVGVSDDGGASWTDHVVMTGIDAPIGSPDLPWMYLDRDGNVYVVANGRAEGPGGEGTNGMWLSVSTDHGDTWSKMRKVNRGVGWVAFPTVVAGQKGLVDLAWIEAQTQDVNDDSAVWKLHFAQTRNALSSSPSFKEVTGPVVHRGALDRALLDFMDMALDSFGYAHVVVASTLPELHVLWWRQDAGPSVYSNPCTGSKGCVYSRPQPRP